VYIRAVRRIIEGDNVEVLPTLPRGSARLVYVDPPFNTGKPQRRDRMRVRADPRGQRGGFGGRRYRVERLESSEYADRFDDYVRFLLARIEAAGVPWGVVTNKPGWLTEPLLAGLGLAARAACVVSGDTLSRRKPDPAPLLHACATLGAAPARSVYVGDDERDVVAGRAAGMRTLVALFGYIGTDRAPAHWGATALVARPEDIWQHLAPGAPAAEAS